MGVKVEEQLVGTSVFARIGLIGMLAAALALGACGRKGPLEMPPSASSVSAAPPQQAQQPVADETPGFEGAGTSKPEPALPPARRTFILDGIL